MLEGSQGHRKARKKRGEEAGRLRVCVNPQGTAKWSTSLDTCH